MSNELTEERYQQLRRKANQAKEDAQQAKGALAQLMRQLREEFSCESVKEANEKLRKLEVSRDAAKKKYLQAEAEYRKQWGAE